MDYRKRGPFFSVYRFEKINSLVHGFGSIQLVETAFSKGKEWKDFKTVSLRQTHSNIVHRISTAPAEKLTGDALLTDCAGIFLVIKTADCLPVLLVDESKRAVGAVHCGWKGTALGVVKKTIQVMKDAYGSDPCALLAALGPSISEENYEVGEDVLGAFQAEEQSLHSFRPSPTEKDKYYLDIREANLNQLLEMGINKENVFSVGLNTFCEKTLLSYRASPRTSERLLNFIGWSK
jgi:YfiH family protein